MVSAASRMFSAISLGVFWRLAPSTMAIMRSRKVSPGLAVMRTTSQSDKHACAAGHRAAIPAALADDGRALARDGAFVDRGHAFDHFAIAGMVSPASTSTTSSLRSDAGRRRRKAGAVAWARQFLGRDVAACLAQRVGLRLATPFGHRFGEVGEQHREPQPGGNGEDEAGRRFALPKQRLDKAGPWSAARPPATINITGLRTWWRGFSLRTASTRGTADDGGSNKRASLGFGIQRLYGSRHGYLTIRLLATMHQAVRRWGPTPAPARR